MATILGWHRRVDAFSQDGENSFLLCFGVENMTPDYFRCFVFVHLLTVAGGCTRYQYGVLDFWQNTSCVPMSCTGGARVVFRRMVGTAPGTDWFQGLSHFLFREMRQASIPVLLGDRAPNVLVGWCVCYAPSLCPAIPNPSLPCFSLSPTLASLLSCVYANAMTTTRSTQNFLKVWCPLPLSCVLLWWMCWCVIGLVG